MTRVDKNIQGSSTETFFSSRSEKGLILGQTLKDRGIVSHSKQKETVPLLPSPNTRATFGGVFAKTKTQVRGGKETREDWTT